ncbi:MAG: lamin tail domain-containing protein [Patescibacteria group bacterium]
MKPAFLPLFLIVLLSVNINTAALDELDQIIGIGPALGQRIIDARPFLSVDDLLSVKGIGEKTLQKIKDQGLACVNCETSKQEEARPPEPGKREMSDINATYPNGIFINEILPNPKGADETDEWIELSNFNDFDVDLSNWQIQDIAGTITTFTIPKNTNILANGFLFFKRPETKIMLNNDNDGLNLLTPDKKIVDSVSFTSAPLSQSYDKTSTNWQWSATLTPGVKNIISALIIKTLPKAKNSDKNKIELAAADLSQAINLNQENTENNNPWFLFFTALTITIISAIFVLIIKIRFIATLKNKNLKI